VTNALTQASVTGAFLSEALLVHDLAEKADPFTRKRLLALAGQYDVRADGPSRASGMIDRLGIPLEWPASICRKPLFEPSADPAPIDLVLHCA
jgi:hypothetical protein